jgi:hypothetical protein
MVAVVGTFLVAGTASFAWQQGGLPSPPQNDNPGDHVQCANLVYAGTKSSVCFSDRFMKRLQMETKIQTARKFTRVKLDDAKQLCNYPFAIMTGEGGFTLPERERVNLRYYLQHGGFLVASAGCSNPEWGRSFKREFAKVFPGAQLKSIPLSHRIFRTAYVVRSLDTSHGSPGSKGATLEGYTINGRLALVFSQDGLNDTSHADNGCCCCGGDEINNAEFINANLLAYALMR